MNRTIVIIRPFLLFAAIYVLFRFTCLAEYPFTKNNSIFFHGIRIQVLTPTMIRIQKELNHLYPDITDLGVVNLKFPTVPFTVTKENNKYLIETDSMIIYYSTALDITQGGITASIHGAFSLKSLSGDDSLNLGGVIGSLDNCKGNILYSEQNNVGSS